MSYVLDALRKSEMERRIVFGSTTDVLFPVMAVSRQGWSEYRRPAMIGAGLILGVIVLSGGLWLKSSSAPGNPAAAQVTTPNGPAPVLATPATMPKITQPEPPAIAKLKPEERDPVKVSDPASKFVQNTPKKKDGPGKVVARTVLPESGSEEKTAADRAPQPKEASAQVYPVASKELPVARDLTPPRDLPPLSIAGFILDEQGGSLAMINEKLVHEGEEISPGLRLEKVLDDNKAIFNYRGRRFTK